MSPRLTRSPVSQNAMGRHGGPVRVRGFYQLPIVQSDNGGLHRAFGQTGFIGQHAQAGFDRLPLLASGASGKIKIHEEGRRLLIVPDDIAHEDIEHVIIDWHRSLETRHRGYSTGYTDKRTTLFAPEGSLTLDADEWRVLGFGYD